MAFSDAEILALKPKAKPYKHSLGDSLYVHVWPDGRKYWRISYRFGGKENVYSIGVFPRVSASEALEAKEQVRKLLREGSNPNTAKREAAKLKSNIVSKNIFRLALSLKGALTIETDTKLLILTPSQTKALSSFLAVNHENEREMRL